MSTDASALVVVLPNDDIDSIVAKVQAVNASSVQLLVPEGVETLQVPAHCENLRRSLEGERIGVLIISSDEKTLATARQAKLDTIAVEGAHVAAPDSPPTPPAPRPRATAATPAPPPAPPPEDAYDAFSELDTLGDVMSGSISEDAYDPFSELDALGDVMSGQESAAGTSGGQAAAASAASQPRPRIRPEDIQLSDDELARAASTGKQHSAIHARSGKSRSRSGGPSLSDLRKEQSAGKGGGLPIPIPLLLGVVVVLLLFFVVGRLFFGGDTTIVVQIPPRISQEFSNVPVPMVPPGSDAAEGALVVEPMTAMGVFTVTGTIQHETMSPGSSAIGTLVLLNQGSQAVTLPAGTDFVGLNAAGQEVRFGTEAPVTIPPATTRRDGRSIITDLGYAEAQVIARAPGSNSNIEANTITHFVIPGQQPVALNVGTLLVEHAAIGGGNEQSIRVVTNEDVQPVLGAALTGMNDYARGQLQAIAEARGLTLEKKTISPMPETLEAGEGYEAIISPPLGEPVFSEDAGFTVVVRGQYHALATPPKKPLEQQLKNILPDLLVNAGMLEPDQDLIPTVSAWRWDGSMLNVDGVMQSPKQDDLDATTRALVRNTVRGKSRADAAAALEQLKQQGLIGNYQLPNVGHMPDWDFQLSLRVLPAPEPETPDTQE